MIYFIKDRNGGRIKIGTTIRLSERLKQLARDHGEELEILAVVDGDRAKERELHQQFGHLRIVSEWFEAGDDLLGFIVREGRSWDGTDEVPKPEHKPHRSSGPIPAKPRLGDSLDPIAIGRRIRRLRRDHDLTQEQVAETIETTSQYVSLLEHGTLPNSLKLLWKLSEILGVSIDYLVTGRERGLPRRSAVRS